MIKEIIFFLNKIILLGMMKFINLVFGKRDGIMVFEVRLGYIVS